MCEASQILTGNSNNPKQFNNEPGWVEISTNVLQMVRVHWGVPVLLQLNNEGAPIVTEEEEDEEDSSSGEESDEDNEEETEGTDSKLKSKVLVMALQFSTWIQHYIMKLHLSEKE